MCFKKQPQAVLVAPCPFTATPLLVNGAQVGCSRQAEGTLSEVQGRSEMAATYEEAHNVTVLVGDFGVGWP